MAQEILRFAILGLGAGAIYAVTALGIVVVYRGSGVVNFAHGAIGMVGAFVFYDARLAGHPTPWCWALAIGFGLAFGAGTHQVVMRPLRHAPPLSRLVATLGLMSILLAYGTSRYGDKAKIVGKLLPVDRVTLFGDVAVGKDRLILLAAAVAIAAVLTVVYRSTAFGRATTAVAENRRASAAQGVSPDLVATVNWAAGSVLAVVAAILVVNVTGLSVTGLTLLVVFALAAALVGGLKSFPWTLLGGLVIGIVQSEIDWLQVHLTEVRGHPVSLDGWSQSVPFLVIIVVLLIRGRALPERGEANAAAPAIGSGLVRASIVLPAVGVACALALFVLPLHLMDAFTASACFAVVALSLVVVTGYAGQLSLAQMGLAGMGGWIAATLVADHGAGFGLAALAGVAGAVPIGVLVGLPSLRTRGVNLAIATLGLALVLEAQVLGNGHRTGGLTGLAVGTPSLFGIDLDPVRHPQRYAVLTVLAFTLLALLVANLRRGRAGRRLLAVRTNERAAASLGISVMGAKVYAFGLSAAIAAVGGVLIVFRRPTAVFYPTFSIFQSIFAVVYAVIGGVGFVVGAALAGLGAPGGFIVAQVDDWTGLLRSGAAVQIGLGVLLLVMLWVHPNGVASLRLPARVRGLLDRLSRRVSRRTALIDASPARVELRPMRLEARDLTVSFGGVHALSGVSLRVEPGEVLGLIGPNGAGKTTLVDAVTGFVDSEGAVLIGGRDISTLSARRRAQAGLGRSFQSLELFDTMTVRENLQTASDRITLWRWLTDLVHPGRAALDGHAVAAVHEFGLVDVLEQRPGALPFGRRRLVAIARAVAGGASVILLDEPAAGLDDHESQELGHLIRRLADEWGLTVLLIEHDVSLVLQVCDRVTVLDQGRHLATGTPEQIRGNGQVLEAYLGASETTPRNAPGAVGATELEAVLASRPAPLDMAPAQAKAVPSAVGTTVLAARGLSAGYGDLAAIRDLDLEVRAGEIVALLGPNGAGKTTTLLAMVGEVTVLSGRVELFGAPAPRQLHRLARRGVSFIPDDRSIIGALSTGANLSLGHHDPGLALELFPELEPLLGRRAGLLSGGEQQMLSVARALARRPDVLLVDELSTGLAPLVVERLLAALRRAADDGVGIVLVEQHTADALAVADRALVLRRGQVELDADTADLRAAPEQLETAYLAGI